MERCVAEIGCVRSPKGRGGNGGDGGGLFDPARNVPGCLVGGGMKHAPPDTQIPTTQTQQFRFKRDALRAATTFRPQRAGENYGQQRCKKPLMAAARGTGPIHLTGERADDMRGLRTSARNGPVPISMGLEEISWGRKASTGLRHDAAYALQSAPDSRARSARPQTISTPPMMRDTCLPPGASFSMAT